MKKRHLSQVIAVSVAAFLSLSFYANLFAEEGSAGHVAPGGVATLIDTAPTKPGWVVETMFIHYKGDFGAQRQLPIGGLVSLGLDASIDTVSVGALRTFEDTLWGAHYSAGMFLPFAWMDIKGNVNARQVRDTAQGIGDMTIIPAMLAWKTGNWQYIASLPVYAPTGDYNVGNLANLGLNYWTVDPTFGVVYANQQSGFNAAAHMGTTINSKNSATDYRSGSMLHLEASIQQLLPLGPGFVGVGADGFIFQQVSGDSGSGARRDFKGRTLGVGPVINYILPRGDNTWVFEVKWLPELNTENRLKGDFIWFKAVYQF